MRGRGAHRLGARQGLSAAEIGFISPTAEFTPKTVETRELRTDLVYRLRVIVDNPDNGLRQGMPVTSRCDLDEPAKMSHGRANAVRASSDGRRSWHRSKRLRTGRRTPAIDDLNLRIEPGQVTGLVGPDGAGKTTLMRLLAGLMLPDEGRITVCGFDTAGESGGDPPVGELHAAAVRAVRRPDCRRRTSTSTPICAAWWARSAAAPSSGCSTSPISAPFTDRLAGKLSGGMKQKLGLACA